MPRDASNSITATRLEGGSTGRSSRERAWKPVPTPPPAGTRESAMSGSSQECPQCGRVNPSGAIRCDCGYRFDAPASGSSGDDTLAVATVGRRAIDLAWSVALIWGGITIVVGVLGPLLIGTGLEALQQATGQGFSGLLLISLGLAVKRGEQVASWALVVFGVLDVALRLTQRPRIRTPRPFRRRDRGSVSSNDGCSTARGRPPIGEDHRRRRKSQ